MRNEYTDCIAHGHKYFAVIDIGKKNSAGKKLKRYFYSANEYNTYLRGKKTLDDKLIEGVSKLSNKVDGVKAIAKGVAGAVKATHATGTAVRALKKKGMTEEQARAVIKTKSAYDRTKRAGLTPGELEGTNLHSTDEKGNKYTTDTMTRKITRDVATDKTDQSKKLIKAQREKDAEKSKYSNIFKNTVKKPNQVPAILKPAQKVGELIDKTAGNAIRENIIERLTEKGVNKANAEAMRKKLEETYDRATKIGNSANDLKNKLDNLQEAFMSGDGDKAMDAIDETLKNQEEIQKDIYTIVDELVPEAKKVADTFLDMGKKTLDTAVAGPKAVASDNVDEYLKEHNISKDDVSKEFLEELKENLKKNRK